MIVFLQLTTAGSDSGPFNLYSDLDGYIIPFETDVFKSSLEAGYSTTAPDGTQTVKVVSTGACINSTYITLVLADCDLAGYVEEITTTTTTTTYVCPDCVQGADVLIGTQLWTRCNLDVTTYRDGTPIPEVTDPTAWENLTTGAWCHYDNNLANDAIYGKLYNMYAVAGIYNEASLLDPLLRKEFAPIGYHVPSVEETDILINYLGGGTVAGGNLKTTGTIEGNDGCWAEPNVAATNSSGFGGQPGGYRLWYGIFAGVGEQANWWASLGEQSLDGVQLAGLTLFGGAAYASNGYYQGVGNGNSVRLIQD